MNHFIDRNIDEYSGVIRNFIRYSFGKTFGNFFHFLSDQPCRLQRVCPRLQIDRKSDRRFAVKEGVDTVILSAQFNPRHVFQAQNTPLVIAFKNDVAEFLFIDQPSFGVDRIGIGQILVERFLSELSGGKLRVLFLHRGNYVLRRQIEIGQFVGRQ